MQTPSRSSSVSRSRSSAQAPWARLALVAAVGAAALLAAGCGPLEDEIRDNVGKGGERPTPDPKDDPCAAVRCRAGTHCTVVRGEGGKPAARCAPDETTNPCAATLCKVGETCIVLRSDPPQARCVPTPPPPEPTPDGCARVRCKAGTHCELKPVQCIKAPCPAQPQCVPDAGSGGACGSKTCPEGQVCCNASCGLCAPPGGACIQIACE
jgi:hypothetical protein